jgi:ABC-type dipeptide/oligopeptide/nickel transport system permease subunit
MNPQQKEALDVTGSSRSWREHPLLQLWRSLSKNKLATGGLILSILVVLGAITAPILPLADPNEIDTSSRLIPWFESSKFILGTDEVGRDMMSRLVWGTRASLMAGIVSALLSLGLGISLGMPSAFRGGKADLLAMRIVDILLAFPPLLLAIAIVAGLGPGLVNAMIAVGLVGIPLYARTIRGTVLSLKEWEYVAAARALGAGDLRIMLRHILPNLLPILIVLFTLDIGHKIVITAGLSFLGLGSQPPTADWGSMLSTGRSYITFAPHVATLPGLAIFVTVLAFNLVGDGLRDTLDPRIRGGG